VCFNLVLLFKYNEKRVDIKAQWCYNRYLDW